MEHTHGGHETPTPLPHVQAVIDRLESEGYKVDHFGNGRIDNFSDEGYGLILSPAEYPDDNDGDFLLSSQVTVSDESLVGVGSVFEYVAYEQNPNLLHYELLLVEPRDFTPEEQARIAIRAAELMKVIGEPPTGPII